METSQLRLNVGNTTTIVDREIYKIFKWNLRTKLFLVGDYVYFRKNDKIIPLHRFVYKHYNGLRKGVQIDHEDRNPLNNTIKNLRIATAQQNNLNKEKYSNNKSGLKCVREEAGNGWYFEITLCDRRYKKRGYVRKMKR